MRTRLLLFSATAACLWTSAVVATDGAAPQSDTEFLRGLMAETGVTFKDASEGDRAEFVYHLSLDDDHVEEYRCTLFAEEGVYYANCIAVLPLTIPSNRIDAVAAALAVWNGERDCGRFGLDFERRAAFFVAQIPMESLREKNALATLTLLTMPAYFIAGRDETIRAIARGDATASEDEDGDDSLAQLSSSAGAAIEIGGGATSALEDDDSGEPRAESRQGEVDIPTGELVLNWLRKRGVTPGIHDVDPGRTTYQFPVGLARGNGVFTSAAAQIVVADNWVWALVSPDIRVPAAARTEMAKTLLRVSNSEEGATFMWLPDGRLAVRFVVPASIVVANPSHAISGMLNRAGDALSRHSAELVAALVPVKKDSAADK